VITFEEKRYPSRPDYVCRNGGGKHVGTIFWDGCLDDGEYWFDAHTGLDYNHINQRGLADILEKLRELNLNKGTWE